MQWSRPTSDSTYRELGIIDVRPLQIKFNR